jgi:hypothetical protein
MQRTPRISADGAEKPALDLIRLVARQVARRIRVSAKRDPSSTIDAEGSEQDPGGSSNTWNDQSDRRYKLKEQIR